MTPPGFPGLQIGPLDIVCTLLSLGVAWACLCRLAAGDGSVWASVRAHASLGLGAALASAIAPWLGHPATLAQLLLLGTIALGMVASVWRWRGEIDGGLRKAAEQATEPANHVKEC
jgi:hypothetical protein